MIERDYSKPLNLELVESPQVEMPLFLRHFQGEGYRNMDDHKRLDRQHDRVKAAMLDGEWRTLDEINAITHDPQASISRQLRYLTDPRFGAHLVHKVELRPGLWQYRLVLNPESPEALAAENAHRRFFHAKHKKPFNIAV